MSAHRSAIAKIIERLSHRRDMFTTWRDWLEMMALAMRNAVDKHGWQEREDRYLQVVKGYSGDELQELGKAYAHLVSAMEDEPGDVLGSLYMQLELGNKWTGQFFTPYDVCRMMARMTLESDKLCERIARRGFITVSEPACGGGAMILAFAAEMQAMGFNPQQQMHVTAVDVDIKAVHMTYVQLALLHIPAVIVHGNALTLEQHGYWPTPAHLMGGWDWRLKTDTAWSAMLNLLGTPEPHPDSLPPAPANDNKPATDIQLLPAVGESFSLF